MSARTTHNRFRGIDRKVLVVALWFGLLAGLVEGVAVAVLRSRPGYTISVSEAILWVAPVFNLALFLLMALGISALFSLIRRPVDLRILIGLFTWVILFGALLFTAKIGQFASILLSLGVGVEVGRRFVPWEERLLVFFRRTLGLLVVAALALGVGAAMAGPVRERAMLNQLPAAPAGAPNVILITLDTLRADHVSSYGYSRETTPNLDRLASGGALFESAFSNSSWTLPAHATLFTGRLPNEHQANWKQPLSEEFPTLAQALYQQGYRTGGFAANTFYVAPEWGLAHGFTHFEVYGASIADYANRTIYGKKLALNLLPRLGYYDIPGRKGADQVNEEFFRWLDDSGDRPFFAFLNYLDVHDPYLVDRPYQTQFSSDVTQGDVINFQFQVPFRRKVEISPEEIQQEINSYDGALYYLDSQLGRLFAELERRGLDQNTLLIVTSDHGESFGIHDLFGHGNSLYLESLHVPLIIHWAGKIEPGMRLPQVVGLHQVPTTVLDLLRAGGVTVAEPQFPGASFADLLLDPEGAAPAGESAVLAELSSGRFEGSPVAYPNSNHNLQAVITGRWHLILSDAGQAELYDWRADREELHDLSGTPEGKQVIENLMTHFPDWTTQANGRVGQERP